MARATHDDDLGRKFAEGSIDLSELNAKAAEAGAAATTADASSSAAERGKLADARPATSK